MLTFTAQQMKAMAAPSRHAFEQRTMQHLRRAFPERLAGVPDERIVAFIQFGIERAKRYGIVGRIDVRRYLVYMLTYGTRFDTDPAVGWAGEILRNRTLGPSRRMDMIDAHHMFRRERG